PVRVDAQGVPGNEDRARLLGLPHREQHVRPADDGVDRSFAIRRPERFGHGVVGPVGQVVAVDDQQGALGRTWHAHVNLAQLGLQVRWRRTYASAALPFTPWIRASRGRTTSRLWMGVSWRAGPIAWTTSAARRHAWLICA